MAIHLWRGIFVVKENSGVSRRFSCKISRRSGIGCCESPSFPSGAWERLAAKLCFASQLRRLPLPLDSKQSFAAPVPKQSLGTRELMKQERSFVYHDTRYPIPDTRHP